MAYLVGVLLALAVGGMGTVVGLDRAFYPTVMVVIASYYVLFAVMGGSTHALRVEAAVAAVFLTVTLAGFKYSLWLVVAALAAHGILDAFHGQLIANPGVPVWRRRSASRTTAWPPGTWDSSSCGTVCGERAGDHQVFAPCIA